MAFQTAVNYQPSPGVVGAFCSANPRANVITGAGAFVAGTGGVNVGSFAWTDSATNTLVTNTGTGVPRGFIANELQAMISTWMGEASLNIPEGRPVTLFNEGDFWMLSSTASVIGQKIFASLTDGSVQTGAAGATISGYIETKWYAASIEGAGSLIKASSWGY